MLLPKLPPVRFYQFPHIPVAGTTSRPVRRGQKRLAAATTHSVRDSVRTANNFLSVGQAGR